MLVSIKDTLKLVGITIVCFCAVYVCTFFLNCYIDVLPLKNSVSAEALPLYNAQLATAKMTCGITGGVLGLIAIIMLVFYIKIYVDTHSRQLGIFKAMGYSDLKISKSFLVFGLSTFIGCALGFGLAWASMPFIYSEMSIDVLPEVAINFHPILLIFLVFVPTVLFSLLSFLFGIFALKKTPLSLINNSSESVKVYKIKTNKIEKPEQSFLIDMSKSSIRSKKLLVFFVTFASFCFASMVQMGLSMEDLVSGTMGYMILAIGLVLAITASIMSLTSLIRSNEKNISIMKAFGYGIKDCFLAVFSLYIPFLVLGFMLGTIYQYGLLLVMINIVFKSVGNIPSYTFNVEMLFVTLALFVVFYLAVLLVYYFKVKKVSIKKVMMD